MFLLTLCHWAIDIKGWRWWTKPFAILGVNALASIRVQLDDGRVVSVSSLIYTSAFEPLASPKNASLLYALANLAVLFVILLWMYRRRIFLRA